YRSRESVYSEFSVELVAEPADAGFVNGSGYYLFGDRAQLNASPSNGFQFVCWINQDGDTISCDPDYRHFVTRNNLITALFDEVSDMPEFSSNSALIWPNPVSDVLSIDGLHDNDIITIYDVTGCMVYRQSYHGNTRINMSTLNSGIYFMSVESVSGKSVLKLVKQ
ncbi:MAG TPA: T9SS type A sorting domain-containing protein, partial [Bacteroidetes bacterium]|nr:T9SS type A sorting domain-containing protein [Candidatus Limimorpha avicola]